MTGYTQKLVEEGQDFKSFVMTCARAFGACVTLRDEALSDHIPEFKVGDYYPKAVKQAKARLAKMEKMTPAQQLAYGKRQKLAAIKSYAKELIPRDEMRNKRVQEMIDQVKDWEPPSAEHVNLKNFMLEQLGMSKEDDSYWRRALEQAEAIDETALFAEHLETARRDVTYYTAQLEKEKESVRKHNLWVRQLVESLEA